MTLVNNFQSPVRSRRFRYSPYFVAFLLFVMALVIYLKNFRVYSVIGIQDTEPNQLLPISLLGDGNFYFDEFVGPAGELPAGTVRLGSHVVSMYPIVPGLLNLPAYLLARAMGLDLVSNRLLLSLITAATLTALSVAFIYLVLIEVCQYWTTALLGTFVYAFGTGVWSTASQGLWQHGPSLLFINIALWLLLKNKAATISWAGLWLGLAVFNRPSNALIALPLALFVFVRHRSAFARFLGLGAIPLLLMAWYSSAVLGSIFTLGQTQALTQFSGDILAGLPGLLISPSRGLFIFTPVFLFSGLYLLRVLYLRQTETLYWYLTLPPLGLVLLYSKWYSWWGGFSFGYRLLLELVPFLTIFLVLCYEAVIVKRRCWKILFWAGVIASFYTHYLGAYYYPCGFNYLPVNINFQTERLWNWGQSELALCTRSLLENLRLVQP